MLIDRRGRGSIAASPRRRHRRVLVALAAAVVLGSALAGAVAASSGPTDLSEPTVSPRSAAEGTPIAFGVTFLSHDAAEPAYVRVRVGSVTHALRRTGTGSTRTGIRYVAAFGVPVGTWPVTFESSARNHVSTLAAGMVSVSPRAEPTPKPTAAAKPTFAPPTPSLEPTSRPIASAGPTPTARPTSPAAASTATVTPPWIAPDPSMGAPGASWAPPASSSGPDPTPRAAPAAGGPTTTDGPGGPDSNASAAWPGSSLTAIWLRALLGRDLTPTERVIATAISATTGVTLAMSFALFGKRRRDDEPTAPEEALAADAASTGRPADAGLARAPAAAASGELAMPRWRRPSLLAARKADPLRSPVATYRLTFDDGSSSAGLERRRIRYRVVRLLDGPDELMAAEIGLLDEGDEVQLLERSGSFWRVLCPDGRTGWVHRMVLGEIVPSGTDDAIDADVLAAFQASRARAS